VFELNTVVIDGCTEKLTVDISNLMLINNYKTKTIYLKGFKRNTDVLTQNTWSTPTVPKPLR
jgi:hypothetical protein